MQAPAYSSTPGNEIVADSIVARRIVLKHPDCTATVTLEASSDGAGIWVARGNNDENLIAIYATEGGTAVGIYGKDKNRGCAVALSVDKDGSPVAQLVSPSGEMILLGFEELKRIAGK